MRTSLIRTYIPAPVTANEATAKSVAAGRLVNVMTAANVVVAMANQLT